MDRPAVPLRLDSRGRCSTRRDGAGPGIRLGVGAGRHPLWNFPDRRVPPAQIRRALALTPGDAEVISTIYILGRFCSRPHCYWFYPDGTVPVQDRNVVFVFDPAAENQAPVANAADDIGAIAFVREHLHARTLVDADGVTALLWRPPPGTTRVEVAMRPRAPSGRSPRSEVSPTNDNGL